jgi:hypothetical protein
VETWIPFLNAISSITFLVFIVLMIIMKREGDDERAQAMQYRLFRFSFFFVMAGLSFLILISGWIEMTYTTFRSLTTTMFSLTLISALCYWLYLQRKF